MNAAADQRHLLARLVWDSAFDAPADVRAQQDWLSAFSREALPQLLDEVFNACCPAGQTWRCERLQIDLGKIRLADAKHDLPRRLRSALTEALQREFGAPPAPAAHAAHAQAQAQAAPDQAPPHPAAAGTNDTDALTLLEHLLMHGSAPWWHTKPLGLIALWDGLRATEPDALALRLDRLGSHEQVRERLVWQLGRARMPELLRLLRPTHADALTEWVREVVARHAEERLVPEPAGGFESAAWLALLTCLMAERGSHFNATEFASAHLRQLAQRYDIPYASLLARLQQTCARHALALPRRFLGLVRAVCARDLEPPPPHPAAPLFDGWQVWPVMLAGGQARLAPAQGGHSLQQIFLDLAEQDGPRAASLLKGAGRAASGVLAQHFS